MRSGQYCLQVPKPYCIRHRHIRAEKPPLILPCYYIFYQHKSHFWEEAFCPEEAAQVCHCVVLTVDSLVSVCCNWFATTQHKQKKVHLQSLVLIKTKKTKAPASLSAPHKYVPRLHSRRRFHHYRLCCCRR